ncbi:hypothetical protein A3E17_00990 [Candidatus Amesbacteria bacterium RIFCSPHIGHO2_12_FULL_48_14]|uniref:Uncharacterized protein n=1 Tax=Candidatus Amesbacteria bacterium RIFCSPHIGHO2_12_FULL_48_14 TaxID=1797257 RepID=A0A1F4ZAC6_9BACT|nr:MAG: hypothetical protein A2702_00240 [Candidatus Amesbacteria bacterium RIFCSPHIGHO2_01_FULL_48_75]OGD03135.1 MAG: hypothetical protein A3E17_00990 [Candidatus Amesbacteria bacterium RIFCSPHIGHO2_12_FULL_48_14]OGD06604.1 MAG: hypothetical protein A3B58_02465 [Candidatus Amesbacteria bacterium RIFCSPLOWO2_01_FULL_48_50]
MLTLKRGNIFAFNRPQESAAVDILSKIEGKKLEKLYDGFLSNLENKLKSRLTGVFPVVHAITYPDHKVFVDVTFLEKPRPKWSTPKASGSIYHLRKLQNRIGELIRIGKVVNKNLKTGKYNATELKLLEEKLRSSLDKDKLKVSEILKSSRNPKEIAEYILLLQYIKPSEDLLDALYQYLSNEYEIVQNNAAYVIGGYLSRVTDRQFRQILSLLDSRFSSPINKGLYLMSKLLLTDISKNRRQIICERANSFLTNRQPNISLIAEMISKECDK